MCPKNPIIFLSLVLTTAFTASPGAAATFTVELPGLEGPYEGGGGSRTDYFDFGATFLSIDEVRIGWTGTITPGEGHGDGVELPADEWFEWPARYYAVMNPPGPGTWTAFAQGSSFSTEEPFSAQGGATWDFLLDGAGEIDVNLEPEIVIGGVMVTPPSGQISNAYLVIEGVSEGDIPTVSQWGVVAMALLVLTTGTLVFKRRRRVSLDRVA